MVLETERLVLREMTPADFPTLCKILRDDDVMYAYGGAVSLGVWAVILKETGIMIGQCGLTMQDCNNNKVLEVGYIFQKEYWHNGYESESAIACIDKCIQHCRGIDMPHLIFSVKTVVWAYYRMA